MRTRLIVAVAVTAVISASCDATVGGDAAESTTTIAGIELVGEAGTTLLPTTSRAADADVSLPALLDVGCDTFDLFVMANLTRMSVPMTIITEVSTPRGMYCGLLAVADGRDASAVIEVLPSSERRDGFYSTPGEFETELDLAGLDGVGTGRGSLRAQLTDDLGLTITVTLRALRSEVTPYTDREHLEIRDAVALYIVEQLQS